MVPSPVLSPLVQGRGAGTARAFICLLVILDTGHSVSSLVQLQVYAPASGSPQNPPSSQGNDPPCPQTRQGAG